MAGTLNIKGRDIRLDQLVPLNERHIDLNKSRGYQKILSSIRAVGLIEPLIVYEEGDGRYVILDGYLRYMACRQLGIEVVPCIIHSTKEAYTFNRMVNRLSAYQEMRMLRKAMEKLDKGAVAAAFGVKSIRYRLSPTLLKKVHPAVAKAFEEDLITRNCAIEFALVKPRRQAEIVREMRHSQEYSLSFLRAMVLKSEPEDKTPAALRRTAWGADAIKQGKLASALKDAERQHGFYASLYRQYTTDLLRMVPYVRKIVTTPRVADFLAALYPAILEEFRAIAL